MNSITNLNVSNYNSDSEVRKVNSIKEKSSVSIDTLETAAIYTRSKEKEPSEEMKIAKKMKDDLEQNMLRVLKESVLSSVLKQGAGIKGILEKLLKGEKVEGIYDKITAEDIAEAKINIAADGYWSAESTSSRLVNFAKAVSNSDPSKGEMLKDAIIQGFDMAKEIWGEELPEICNQTRELTMQKMDDWMNENH
ncbi:MAG TPA: hypothetical protein DEP72_04100 [Clostridiales bacterium]|nr:MAG: hypothetical protein A2Y18_04380 [Clostridiales bacterium GWD2_32_19]HCC07325.1 hypothetical protein [Clostridiales bacterium]